MSDLDSLNEQATQLSPRQQEILRLLGSGLSLSESANRLEISRSTANSHRARLMERLELNDRSALIDFAQHWPVTRATDDGGRGASDECLSERLQEVCVASPGQS